MPRKYFEVCAWIGYIFTVNTVGAGSVRIEYARNGLALQGWEPFVWEYSSGILVLLLIPTVIWLDRYYPLRERRWKTPLLVHIFATIPFSLVHVTGMVALRKLIYGFKDLHYDFGDVPVELFYEYRKDFLSYFFILAVLYAYRLYRSKTAGAAYETNPPKSSESAQFIVQKNGLSTQVNSEEIAWVEAAGNYGLLHVGKSVHPLRDTMKGITEKLGPAFFRSHRSVIVNLSKITATRGTRGGDLTLFLDNGVALKCSRNTKVELEKRLGQPRRAQITNH